MTVSMILDWHTLHAALPAAGILPDGTTLTPTAALAALCDAGIIPMIFTPPANPCTSGGPPADSPPPFAGPSRPGIAAAPGRLPPPGGAC